MIEDDTKVLSGGRVFDDLVIDPIEGIFVEVVGDLISSTVVLLVFRERELEASQPLISSKQLFNIDMLVDVSGRLQYI